MYDLSKFIDIASHETPDYPAVVMGSDWLVQYNHFFTGLHVDPSGGSCYLPATLQAMKIWFIIQASKYDAFFT